ncbi:MAG: hypothetical protein K2M07_04020 [Muribaculaceae bacterium]|nr:hypothetical protein [Muribaculaceae bacterium]
MLSEWIRNLIAERFGREVRYSQECEALSEDIFERTGERLGVSTLKRMFGFTGADVAPRPSTMDIIAKYLGFNGGYKELEVALRDGMIISAFDTIDTVDTANLQAGTRVVVCYSPNRRIVMSYMGDGQFRIVEAVNSKLMAGDTLRVENLTVGFEFYALDVIRDGKSLGAYRAAKNGGIASIDIL